MHVVTLPGVFRPISDTWLLADAVRQEVVSPRAAVLDVCTGSGVLAAVAAMRGARDVVAVDVSRRAVLSAWLTARANGVRVRVLRGDLLSAVQGARFDLIVSNPPYVPSETDDLPIRGPQRAWDAGRDGRAILDRLIEEAPAHLRPGGALLVVHSEVCGVARTCELMAGGGLEPDVVLRHRGPLGPLMRDRLAHLEHAQLLEPGRGEEEVVVIRGRLASQNRPTRTSGPGRPSMRSPSLRPVP